MINKLIVIAFLIASFVFASGTPTDVQEIGQYVYFETTVNVSSTPVLVTPSMVVGTQNVPFLADAIVVVPQDSQSYTDLWYDTKVTTTTSTGNILSTTTNKVWRPVGAIAYETNGRSNVLYPNGYVYGINGVVLKKTSGSSIVGVQFLLKQR